MRALDDGRGGIGSQPRPVSAGSARPYRTNAWPWKARSRDCKPITPALKKELVTHDLPLPGGMKPEPAAKPDEPRLQLPNDAEFNQVMGFIEKVWRRLAEMITNVQRDLMKKS